ncbi:MAG: pyridoxamine 5'-phosphate oxidase family protein [Acidimicrobiales bacterium]
MPYTDERTGLEVVTLAECVRYLESKEVARVAFAADDRIHVYPVNYVWDGEAIVFRSEVDSTVAGALGSEVVLEVDHLEPRERDGWSVIARGLLELVDPERTPELAARLRRLALYPWAGGEKEMWMRVLPAPLTGRRARRSIL